MGENIGRFKAIALVFLASACTMVIELVAGRVLAPYIGVSVYTWTSIIGVVLAGISVGNYLGGRVGDRYPSTLVLSGIFVAGGMLSLAILPLTLLLKSGAVPASVHLMTRATVYTFVLFFLPTMSLGMTTPIVAKLVLKDIGKTANVIGTLYAFSCAGSILGTFLTGFLLISRFGTRAIVWQVAAVLFAMAVFASGFWKSRAKQAMLLAGVLAYAGVFAFRHAYQTTYTRESNYYAINVYDSPVPGRNVKGLSLDHLTHSLVDLNDPTYHAYGYEKTFSAVARYVAGDRQDLGVFCIGGGGYSFSRYLEVAYPKAGIEVAEIDPAVTRTAYEDLALPAASRIVTRNEDARIFLMGQDARPRYDLVVGDAFNDMSVPYHLTTFEFNEEVRKVLKPDGFYIANVIDNVREGLFARSFMKTLMRSFRGVYLVQPGGGWGLSTYVVIATNRDFDRAELDRLIRSDPKEFASGTLMTLEEVEGAAGPRDAPVLTDDFVPVDNMIAPLFARG
jgi:spermidine synthase